MPSPYKKNIIDLLSNDISWWAKYLVLEKRTLKNIIEQKGTIHIRTAHRIVDWINKKTWEKAWIDFYFDVAGLRGGDQYREVKYSYTDTLSDTEKSNLIRFIIEKKWHAFSLLDVLLFLLALGIISIIIMYFLSYE